jgi:hypothetical protein
MTGSRDPAMTGGGSGFTVELGGLTDFAGQVRTENNNNLRLQTDSATTAFSAGVRFGARSPSSAVLAAKEMYRRALSAAIDTLDGYVEAAEVLASAAETVAKNYSQSDAMSAARTAEVRKALGDAIVKVQDMERRRAAAARRAI